MSVILRWKTRKTRKPHRCFGCSKKYPAGANMVNAAYVDGGTVYSCYWCEACAEYMNLHFELGDEASEGEIFANDPEEWERIYAEQQTHPRA